MSDYTLHQIEVGNDLANYIYLLHCTATDKTAVIDPTFADPVNKELQEKDWQLSHILTTHHHHDHVGGVEALAAQHDCPVYGFAGDAVRIPGITHTMHNDDTINIGNLRATILEIPGHTTGHIAYYFAQNHLLFSGDMLFSLGCGRMFEGNPRQMTESLTRIATLPDATLICAAHEYTMSNAAFALTVEPNNSVLQERAMQAQTQRDNGEATVPVKLGDEKAANPFLRLDSEEIRQTLYMPNAEDFEIFAELRARKDRFLASTPHLPPFAPARQT